MSYFLSNAVRTFLRPSSALSTSRNMAQRNIRVVANLNNLNMNNNSNRQTSSFHSASLPHLSPFAPSFVPTTITTTAATAAPVVGLGSSLVGQRFNIKSKAKKAKKYKLKSHSGIHDRFRLTAGNFLKYRRAGAQRKMRLHTRKRNRFKKGTAYLFPGAVANFYTRYMRAIPKASPIIRYRPRRTGFDQLMIQYMDQLEREMDIKEGKVSTEGETKI